MSRSNEIGKYKTKVFTVDGEFCVQYHQTVVFRGFPNGVIVLDTGGWKTATTKLRMNQAFNQLGLRFGVYQEKGQWWVSVKNEEYVPIHDCKFEGDACVLTPNGGFSSGSSNMILERARNWKAVS